MNNITFSQSNCKEETTSIWLAAVMQYGLKTGFFKPIENFKLKIKEIKYSVYQKLMTIIISIIIGCEYMKDINEKLANEKLSANMIGLEKFPDQSDINRMLKCMDSNSVEQLSSIHNILFMKHSNSVYSDEDVIIDFDQTGLIANGRTYELAEKGYFPKKKSQRGYQMSAAFTGRHSETVSMFLDPGNNHSTDRFDDLLKSTLSKYKEQLRLGKLIIRGDSGYGSMANIEKMQSIENLKFVTKGYSVQQASNLAKDIPYSKYKQVKSSVWVYELPIHDSLRTIIVQTLTKSGELKYTTLISNINVKEMNTTQLFHFYNNRQTIEAFFKTVKNVYSIKNLRTKKFYGIYSFLWLVFITHNLITWYKTISFEDTKLDGVGVKVLVKEVGHITAKVDRTPNGINIIIPAITKLSRLIADALTRQRYMQLSFFSSV
jgi:hypothetical protein